DDTGDDDGRHTDEVSGCGHQAGATEQGAGDQADDGHLSAAGDEAGGHDRHAAV
ncbi:DNA-cytosine methylase, partial [Dysosmobacter welbionis]